MSLDNLPVGWMKVSLGECLDIVRGASPRPKGDPKYFGGDIAWISIKDINAEKGRYLTTTRETVTQLGAEKSRLLEEGSLILSNSGSVCIPKILKIQGCIHDGFVTFPNLNKYFSADYFYHYFNYIRPAVIEANKQGVTQVNLNTEIVKGLDVILSSTPEQQEIVRQLDVMLAQVEQIKARLDAIPVILKKFRQSVLADAVNGKLTEEWRGTSEINNWHDKTLGDIAIVKTGKTPSRKESKYWESASIPWLTSSATGNKFTDSAEEFISEIASKECNLKPFPKGTLLLAMYGEGKTRGQVTELLIEATCNQACAAILVNKAIAHTSFVKIRLLENYETIRKAASGGNQPNLNLNKVREIDISLPTLDEQLEIVNIVKSLFVYADKIEETVQSAQKRVNLLTQSILAKAFSGELTAEWREQHQALITGVNSAESLLAKIQAEREASKPVKKTRAKKEA